tara:strand:- start:117 stop:968 length:852 start_codon:yes stop_codon:yes gene_type:complete
MNGSIEQRMDVDCLWNDSPPTKEPTHLIVFNQDEHGFATTMAGAAIIGDSNPIANFYSKLMSVPATNFAPYHNWQESYRLYETRSTDGHRFFILKMPRVHDVDLSFQGMQNDHSWLYTYPIVRDIVLILNQYGVNKLSYMSSNLFQLHKRYSHYAGLQHGHIAVFDWMNTEEFVREYFGADYNENDADYIFAPNVWIWCKIFADFCFNPIKSEVILCKGDTNLVDADSADSIVNHLVHEYGLIADEGALQTMTEEVTKAIHGRYVKLDLEDSQDDYTDLGFEP